MSTDNIFGPLLGGADVGRAVRDTIERWQHTYLAEVERHTGRDAHSLPPFRSWLTVADIDRMNEDQLPSCVMIVPGLADPPRRNGDGTTDVSWLVGVAAVVSARDAESSDMLAKDYVLATRLLLAQQGNLGGFARGSSWVDERYDILGSDDRRTITAGVTDHVVHVSAVLNTADGPTVVPIDPYADPGGWTTILTASADTTAMQ